MAVPAMGGRWHGRLWVLHWWLIKGFNRSFFFFFDRFVLMTSPSHATIKGFFNYLHQTDLVFFVCLFAFFLIIPSCKFTICARILLNPHFLYFATLPLSPFFFYLRIRTAFLPSDVCSSRQCWGLFKSEHSAGSSTIVFEEFTVARRCVNLASDACLVQV